MSFARKVLSASVFVLGLSQFAQAAEERAIDCTQIYNPNTCLYYSPTCKWDNTEGGFGRCEVDPRHDWCSQFNFNPSGCLANAPFCGWDNVENHCEQQR